MQNEICGLDALNPQDAVVGEEPKLEESEQGFRDLAESMPQIVWATRPDGWNTYFNQQWVDYTGLTMEESHGHGWNVPFHPDDQKRAWDAWQHATQHGATYSLEVRLKRADGVYRWWLVRGVPQRDQAGNIIKWFGTCTDIHDIKLAEEERRRLNSELEQRAKDRTSELRMSEERHHQLFETTLSGVVYQDALGKIISVNPAAIRILGRTPEEFVGQTSEDVEHHTLREDGSLFPAQEHPSIVALRTGHEVRDTVMGVYNPRERAYRWININAVPLFRQGEADPAQVYAMFEDITERKRAEEAIHNSERLYRAIGESINYGIWICAPDGRNIYASESFLKLVGITQEQCSNFGWGDILHPEDAERTIAAWKECVRTGGVWDVEHRFRGVDGKWHPLLARGVPVRDERGKIIHWAGINLDISKLKETEETLRSSLTEVGNLRAALDEHAIVATTDPAGKITFVNDHFCTISQRAREELLGQDHRILSSGYHSQGFFRDLWTTITSGRVWKGEFRNRAKDGTFYWVDTTIVPFLDEHGRPMRFIAIGADITPRKLAEEALQQLNADLERRVVERTSELERSNHDLEQFAYIASHDLQEPLRGVGGCVQILRNRYQGKLDARADELITHAVEGVTRMQTLINDLLAYSRVGRQVRGPEKVDASKALEATLVNLRGAIREADAVITHDELPTVNVAPVELGQLFQNLVGNALKYRAGDRVPQIHVSAEQEPGGWRFSVRDNGIGIERQYYERIFGIFQRLHTQRSYSGTGIGLAVCKKIVETWGGQIGVESTPGQGSRFWFTVPSRPHGTSISGVSTL